MERRTAALALGWQVTMAQLRILKTWPGAARCTLRTALLAFASLFSASCASLSQEQIIANEQTRLEQESRGYFDRESSAAQKKAEEQAAHEALRRKK